MKAIEIIKLTPSFKHLGKNESNYSVDGNTTPSTSYLLRSFKQGQIKINGEKVEADSEIEKVHTIKFRSSTIY